MLDFLKENLNIIEFYLPIGVIGAVRWMIWTIKKLVGLGYRPQKEEVNNFNLSVVAAVYNEKPEIFRQAIESWALNLTATDEIIAVIDQEDKTSIEIFKNFTQTHKQVKLVVTPQPGKRPALADGLNASKNEIVAFVDSDTVWRKDIRQKALSPFSDPLVGGVATRQEVLIPNTLQGKLFNIQLSNRYLTEYPFLARIGNALTCLSGRTAFYRKEALAAVIDKMVNEKFLGVPCVSGEDKALTRLIQAEGWKTKYMRNVVVMTPGAPSLLTFFKQQTRWLRNSWREDILSLSGKWIWKREKILALYMIDRFVQPFFLLLGPIYLLAAIVLNHWVIVAIILGWWLISRGIKIIPHLKEYPRDIFILPAYVLSAYVAAIIKIYALLTMNKQGWITRWDKSRLRKTASLAFLLAISLGTWNATKVQAELDIAYNQTANTIEVKGPTNTITLSEISNALGNNKKLLERLGPAEWLLRVNLKIFDQVTLQLYGQAAGGDASWLKLLSEPDGYVSLESSNGDISIKDSKVTSWDTRIGDFDTAFLDESGRAFIAAKNRSTKYVNRMDVINSEVAYLGFFDETAYGISWKVISEPGKGDTGLLGQGMTGAISQSKFHHNYYGIYVWGVGDMEVRNNEIYENYRYGFDAHTLTQRTLLEDNYSHDNGWHGIIFADRSTDNIIRRNIANNNKKGHGIMLHEQSNNNTIEDNEVSGSDDGIPLFESSNNIIRRNTIKNNNSGIRVYGRTRPSSENIFEDNTITENKKYGIYLYDAATKNIFSNNRITANSDAGIYMVAASKNSFSGNLIQNNKLGIQIDSVSSEILSQDNNIRDNTISDSLEYGIYSYATPESNILENNIFSNNKSGDVQYSIYSVIIPGKKLSLRTVVFSLFALIVLIAITTNLFTFFRNRKTSPKT